MTLRERIHIEVLSHPGKTATEIAHALNDHSNSVSSILILMWRSNQVSRRKNPLRPRRGLEYFPYDPLLK